MPLEHDLSPFHNWCDRRCELCVLEPRCPAAHPTGTFEGILARTREMLEKLCAEQGGPLDDLSSAPMPGVDALLLVTAAKEHGCALFDLGLETAGVLLAGKVARIASYLDDEKPGGDVWEADAVPNLLLLERLLADLETDIAERRAVAPQPVIALIEKGDELLRALLAPLFATIPTSVEAHLSVGLVTRIVQRWLRGGAMRAGQCDGGAGPNGVDGVETRL